MGYSLKDNQKHLNHPNGEAEKLPERSSSILDEAAEVTSGARMATYGHPSVNHARTAQMWSAYLGIPISMRQVCMLNALQKISRDANSDHRDNLVDLAGWARNAEMCEDK